MKTRVALHIILASEGQWLRVADVARQAGVSRQWLNRVLFYTPGVEVGCFQAVWRNRPILANYVRLVNYDALFDYIGQYCKGD